MADLPKGKENRAAPAAKPAPVVKPIGKQAVARVTPSMQRVPSWTGILAVVVILAVAAFALMPVLFPAPVPTPLPTATPSPTPAVVMATPAPVVTSTPSPTATPLPTPTPLPAGTLFYDNFESGSLSGWQIDHVDSWKIGLAEGGIGEGRVLTASSARVNTFAYFGDVAWQDYAVETNMRLWGGIVRFGLRTSEAGAYYVQLTPTNIVLYKQTGNSTPGILIVSGVPASWGKYLTDSAVNFKVQVKGGEKNTNIIAAINGNKVFDFVDPSAPLLTGRPAFVLIDGAQLTFDNVNVSKA